MGAVYLAREVQLDRLVAIKLLPPELAVQSTLRDRFLREAQLASRIMARFGISIARKPRSDR